MRIKLAEIVMKGDGVELMDLEKRIVSELENGEGKRK